MEVFVNSKRCHRTRQEIATIRQILIDLQCVPPDLTASNLDALCNEIDCVEVNRSILYLQNSPGDFYFIVLDGTVSFYYENDSYVQTIMPMRVAEWRECDFDANLLGQFVGRCNRGDWFGEHSTTPSAGTPKASKTKIFSPQLPNTNTKSPKKSKIVGPAPVGRLCSAVVDSDHTALLIVHTDTYNRLLRPYYPSQRNLLSSINAIRSLPLFERSTYSTVAQVAHNSGKQQYAHNTRLAAYGSTIHKICIILSGKVKVTSGIGSPARKVAQIEDASLAGSVTEYDSLYDTSQASQQLIPTIAVLGPGQVVGELEVNKNLCTYKFNYDVQSLYIEVLEIPYNIYLQAVKEHIFDDPKCVHSLIVSASERANMQQYRDYRKKCLMNPSSAISDDQCLPAVHVDAGMQLLAATVLHCAGDHAALAQQLSVGSAEAVPAVVHVQRVATPPPQQSRPSQARPRKDQQQAVPEVMCVQQKGPAVNALKLPTKPPAQGDCPQKFPPLSPRVLAHLPVTINSPRPTASPSGQLSPRLDAALSPRVSPRAGLQGSPRGSPRAPPRVKAHSFACDEHSGFPVPAVDVATERAAFERRLHSLSFNASVSIVGGEGSVLDSSMLFGGPSTCLEYAATVHEAATSVVQEMTRIRHRVQRMQGKNRGLFHESSLVDCADLSTECSIATASFFPLEASTETM